MLAGRTLPFAHGLDTWIEAVSRMAPSRATMTVRNLPAPARSALDRAAGAARRAERPSARAAPHAAGTATAMNPGGFHGWTFFLPLSPRCIASAQARDRCAADATSQARMGLRPAGSVINGLDDARSGCRYPDAEPIGSLITMGAGDLLLAAFW